MARRPSSKSVKTAAKRKALKRRGAVSGSGGAGAARTTSAKTVQKTTRRSGMDIQAALDPLASALKKAVIRQSAAGMPSSVKPKPLPTKSTPKKSKKKAKKPLPVSPLAPKHFPALGPVKGVRLAVHAAGIKYKGRKDLLVAVMPKGTQTAGVFTTSKTASAPVEWCKSNLDASGRGGKARALIVNSGNSNAFTGKKGHESVKDTARAAAAELDCAQKEIYIASTGVIGEPLDASKITEPLPRVIEKADEDAWRAAAEAIMTTDTFPKAATATAIIDGVPVTINGIAKGSGMIAPDMATMLAFIFTDAEIPADVLQTLLILNVRDTFNAITVDGDTSTSDTVMLFATGAQAGYEKITRAGDRRLLDFRRKLSELMMDLAMQVVRDGEGATKLITVEVTGAASSKAAGRIARSIADSPLVKTAVAGEDANWGRVVMAVGKAGEEADRDKLAIRFGPHVVAENGERAAGYDEATLSDYMKGQEIAISVDVGVGGGAATVYTCDLTHGYISINADYRS